MLQGGKPGNHCCFRAARSTAGLSFRYPNAVCEITFAGKGSCALQPVKPRRNDFQRLPNATKKAVLLKNCFVPQNSKNDIPIKDQNAVEKPPELPFNGLSSSVLRTRRKLSYCAMFFYSQKLSKYNFNFSTVLFFGFSITNNSLSSLNTFTFKCD